MCKSFFKRCRFLVLMFVLILFPAHADAKKNPDVYMTVKDSADIPISFYNGNYYYHSTNENVMKFSDTGKMVAKKRGNCNVVLTHFDSDNKPIKTQFKVRVHDKVKNFKWKKKTVKLAPGKQYKFEVKYKVASKKNVALEWKSSKKSVATVDKDGVVTALKKGTTTIRCSVKGQKKTKVSVKLEVKYTPISSISLSRSSMKLKIGQKYNINSEVKIKPVNATNEILNTTSSDASVVKVVNGVLYGMKKGSATITIQAAENPKKETQITVYVDDWIYRQDARFIAHRGLSAEAPENTLTAFRLAGEKRFHATECDVYVTKDGKFVISHDGNLSRMCGVNKNISELTFAQIQSYPIVNGSNYTKYKNDPEATHIPSLTEYLKACLDSGIVPMIEIKFYEANITFDDSSALYRMYKEIKQVMGNEDCYVISFGEANIKNFNEIKKKNGDSCIKLCLLVGGYQTNTSIGIYQYCIDNNIGFSVADAGNDDLIRKIKADKGWVGVWTVNNKVETKRLIKLGVDFIVTDTVLWDE